MNLNYNDETIFFKKGNDEQFLTMYHTNINVYEHNIVLSCDTSHEMMSELNYRYRNDYLYDLHILSENSLLVLNTVHIDRLEYCEQMELEMNIIFDNKIFHSDIKNYLREKKIDIIKQKIKNE